MRDLFSPRDFVVLKIDAEGAEWRLLPHLLRAGASRRNVGRMAPRWNARRPGRVEGIWSERPLG